MDGGENHHRILVRVNVGYLLVHIEQVTVLVSYSLLAKTLDSILEVQEYCKTSVVYAITLVATLLGCT